MTQATETTEARGAGRSIAPRRSLPSGRALVGAFLVTVAALGTFVLATSGDDGPTTEFLVTTRDIAAGDTLTAADVRFEAMTLSDDLASRALNTTDGLDGATALRDFRAGELIDVADVIGGVVDVDGDVHEVTFGIPLDRTPASLIPGDRVTVLATSRDITELAVEDARVLEIDRQPSQIGSSGRGIITVAIDDPAVVMELAHLTQVAEITVVRSTRAIDDIFPARNAADGEDS